MPRQKKNQIQEIMVVNDSPGEECRIAILQDGHLEELYTERTQTASSVGNIYKGRITNVEPAIQAAFIDFGHAKNGFLHISDLHPKYFPGSGRTERVGKKIPRRERPLIQNALRRGQEVLVQVLKEGIGTKGPTLTSYLSIPGRLMVMMPEMGRVGVSRKIEDEQVRRDMRKLLDTLNLPEGFGFILRTAGIGQTKTELKRDVSYLMRLWKVMDERIRKPGAPRELYTESDLLIRTIRDILRPTISAIIVDSESAFDRVSAFLQVIAPRSAPKILRYRKSVPIFHAFDVERQIEMIHSRSVPLPSGGQIVIDQTEALVAIDVNSSKSRSARDSETNAFQTNSEATDEICRQLRLRDLGGLIINDLIDMHIPRNRRAIEERFRDNLKRDRAKTTALRLSQFGILELTRQRMRPSLRMSHYMACSHCNGHGEVRSPEFVGADASRQLSYLLQQNRIFRVEMVCSPRVATVLLNKRRGELVRLEESTRKKIEVRVSETFAADRVDFYAFDDRNVTVDISEIPVLSPPSIKELEAMTKEPSPEPVTDGKTPKKKRTRRRRKRRSGPADAAAIALAGDFLDDVKDEVSDAGQRKSQTEKKKSRNSGRGEQTAKPQTQKEIVSSDSTMRVHKLAKEIGTTSRDILLRCKKENSITIRNHMSTVSAKDADRIRQWFEGAKDSTDVKTGEKRRRQSRRGGRHHGQRGSETASAESIGVAPVMTENSSAPPAPPDTQAKRRKPTSETDGKKKSSSRKSGARRRRSQKKTEAKEPIEIVATVSSELEKSEDSSSGKKKRLYNRRVTVSQAAREQADKSY
ncbi:MAG: translation initiation factor IF-2 N-terminal domain-containing protein [Planctomycetes bacterium]|nr:translation initiation factor IF-2 N-terminal domain-containing protein [Planctomycetota bacterium]